MFMTVVILALLLILASPVIPWSNVRPWRRPTGLTRHTVLDARPAAEEVNAPSWVVPSTVDSARVDLDPGSPLKRVWGAVETERVERLMVARLLSGEMRAAEYRRAMVQLARLDDVMNPVVVPPPRPTDTDPRPEP